MNTLSWFLYFADVLPAIGKSLGWIASICLVLSLFLWPIFGEDDFKEMKPKQIFGVHLFFVFLLFVAATIPSKDTLYAIAVSEMGEKVLETDLGKKTTRALEIWIENQLPKEAK